MVVGPVSTHETLFAAQKISFDKGNYDKFSKGIEFTRTVQIFLRTEQGAQAFMPAKDKLYVNLTGADINLWQGLTIDLVKL